MATCLILNKQKLACVLTPKVATNSLIAAMYLLAGLDIGDKNPRRFARTKSFRKQAGQVGLEMHALSVNQLVNMRRSHSDYFWFCAKRNPLDRLVSAYHSKVHRYAREADRWAHFKGTLGKFTEGIKAIDNSKYLAKHVARYISFDDMVTGLGRIGLDFDVHFRQQSEVLSLDVMEYSMQLRQENLEEDFRQMCESAGLETGSVPNLQKRNESNLPTTKRVVISEETRKKISRLYFDDFRKLGYATPG